MPGGSGSRREERAGRKQAERSERRGVVQGRPGSWEAYCLPSLSLSSVQSWLIGHFYLPGNITSTSQTAQQPAVGVPPSPLSPPAPLCSAGPVAFGETLETETETET
ncbi:hypothetical protein NDU88_003234 [Pleurodeles waltl]|uniref:Uncharacterized protein n=1 Tax=Pleurodeles waltl TaxID=8319 RepID=A0AAV7KYD3_PLEWA|nr:hypothetical protein NDU88_003234 [Pleurodeles waltl]